MNVPGMCQLAAPILIWLHADNISIFPIHSVPEYDVCITYIISHPTHPHYELLLEVLYVCLLIQ